MNEYEYLIKQLDLLIGFLDVSNEAVYDQIKYHNQFKMGMTIEQLYENSYDNYSNHITISALLLGFTHFEDFISKAIVKILIEYPDKNELKVSLKVIIERGDTLVRSLAKEQSRRLTFSDKLKLIEKTLSNVDTDVIAELKHINDIRNCLMHNNGLADKRLTSKYKEGERIIFGASDVHNYGLKARSLAGQIWDSI